MRTLLDSGVDSIELSLGEEFITFPSDIIKLLLKIWKDILTNVL